MGASQLRRTPDERPVPEPDDGATARFDLDFAVFAFDEDIIGLVIVMD